MDEKNTPQSLTPNGIDQVTGGYFEYASGPSRSTSFVFVERETRIIREKLGITLHSGWRYSVGDLNNLGISGNSVEEISAALARIGLEKF